MRGDGMTGPSKPNNLALGQVFDVRGRAVLKARPMRSSWMMGALLALSITALANAQTPTDAGLKEQLADLERSRQELESATKTLNEERAKLEQATEQAAARQRMLFVAGGVGLLVVVAGGIAYVARRRRGDT
jgi:hypothetical protein